MFVPSKLSQPSVTNNSLVRKLVIYGQKSFITLAPVAYPRMDHMNGALLGRLVAYSQTID
jgi:hypothetical protein